MSILLCYERKRAIPFEFLTPYDSSINIRFTHELSSIRKHRWIYLAKKAHTAMFELPRVLSSNGPRNYNDQLTSD